MPSCRLSTSINTLALPTVHGDHVKPSSVGSFSERIVLRSFSFLSSSFIRLPRQTGDTCIHAPPRWPQAGTVWFTICHKPRKSQAVFGSTVAGTVVMSYLIAYKECAFFKHGKSVGQESKRTSISAQWEEGLTPFGEFSCSFVPSFPSKLLV